MATPAVVAIGGGGFTQAADPALDDFVLGRHPAYRPRLGFVATASGNDAVRIARFYDRFEPAACITSHLASAATPREAARWLQAQDIVYVGGGDTSLLLRRWRVLGLDAALRAAGVAGTLLAGVSAGAVCWFEQALVDGGGADLEALPGLGLIGGSCCAHYSSEPRRRLAFPRCVAEGRLPDGLAIDDGVAVFLAPGRPPLTFTARAGAWAYAVRRGAAGVETVALPASH